MTKTDPSSNSVRALSAEETDTLGAIAERIFPKTDTPGAVEIGAVNYIDIALAGDYAAFLPLYNRGLRAVDQYARSNFGKKFSALPAAQQDAVLGAFEAGSVYNFKSAAEFFEILRDHVLEGVFCEPQYGGNKNMTGWRLVGFPGQQYGYADAYINKPVTLEPVSEEGCKPQKG